MVESAKIIPDKKFCVEDTCISHCVNVSGWALWNCANISTKVPATTCILSDHVLDKLMHTPAFRVPVSNDSSFSRSCF
jgi:hypothetical protein